MKIGGSSSMVERFLAKEEVEGSSPFYRSRELTRNGQFFYLLLTEVKKIAKFSYNLLNLEKESVYIIYVDSSSSFRSGGPSAHTWLQVVMAVFDCTPCVKESLSHE